MTAHDTNALKTNTQNTSQSVITSVRNEWVSYSMRDTSYMDEERSKK